jgi:Na+/H+-dicarboxylate symporter
MRRLLSATGLVLAVITAIAFAALYLDYLSRAGTWFADLPLVLAALPFTLAMRALNGGTYDFAGDMTGRVVAAALFCSALAYGVGLVIETVARSAVAVARSRFRADPEGRASSNAGRREPP